MIFQKLSSLTDRVSIALKESDPDELVLLSEEHDVLFEELRNAGNITDHRLIGKLQELDCQVLDVITKIHQRQQEVGIRIKEVADGNKLARAYCT